mmetsp:Transcript_5376/g.12764  ORF Transcript_5376/g.12764 Transcript_5376/m.12764 type:complete len:229 (-) Transcript_5376:1044-1730(-)
MTCCKRKHMNNVVVVSRCFFLVLVKQTCSFVSWLALDQKHFSFVSTDKVTNNELLFVARGRICYLDASGCDFASHHPKDISSTRIVFNLQIPYARVGSKLPVSNIFHNKSIGIMIYSKRFRIIFHGNRTICLNIRSNSVATTFRSLLFGKHKLEPVGWGQICFIALPGNQEMLKAIDYICNMCLSMHLDSCLRIITASRLKVTTQVVGILYGTCLLDIPRLGDIHAER